MSDFYDELEYPEKAEYLGQYKNYRVDIEHWKELSDRFGKAFRGVYTRGSAAILLVYGPKGAGKSLFCRRLKDDYETTRGGVPDGSGKSDSRDNLWHAFMAASKPSVLAINELTKQTSLELVNDRAPGANGAQWFNELKSGAAQDRDKKVRIYLWDDAHYESIMRPWAGFSAKEFFEARQAGYEALLAHVAQRMNDEVRHAFARSIMIMLSNDRDWVDTLKKNLDKWYENLASVLELPVPAPEALERIVRVNTNRLNRVSYWYCLDNAGTEQRREVRKVLTEHQGYTSSFQVVGRSLGDETRRSGRPSNRNLITLVTLGSLVASARSFLEEREIQTKDEHGDRPEHIGVWNARGIWASVISRKADSELRRRAKMLESEFSLRWLSLDITATAALLSDDALASRLMDLIVRRPSMGTKDETWETWRAECTELDTALGTFAAANAGDITEVERKFAELGQHRSSFYEPILQRRAESCGLAYNRGFEVFRSLRPDIIVTDGEYRACKLISASTDAEADIAAALRRTGHSIELTSFMGEGLKGLEDYLVDKIVKYAEMLESV